MLDVSHNKERWIIEWIDIYNQNIRFFELIFLENSRFMTKYRTKVELHMKKNKIKV